MRAYLQRFVPSLFVGDAAVSLISVSQSIADALSSHDELLLLLLLLLLPPLPRIALLRGLQQRS